MIYDKTEYLFDNPDYKNTLAQIAIFSDDFLRFISREMPNFPSHGRDHSIAIINLINQFVKGYDQIGEEELFYLYICAWLHDIGCIIDRKNHNEHSVKIINDSEFIQTILEKKAIKCISTITLAHSSSYDIHKVPKNLADIRIGLLAAIFRLVDACEISNNKCPSSVYKVIKEKLIATDPEANKFWIAHMGIYYIQINYPIIVVHCDQKAKSELVISRLNSEIESIKNIFPIYKMSPPTLKIVEDDVFDDTC